MARYIHAFTIAFEVLSDHADGDDVTPEMLREALLKRVKQLNDTPEAREWEEAAGAPYDTHELDPEERFPVEDWRQEVSKGDTTRSYQEWLENQMEMAADEDKEAEDRADA